MIDRVNQLQEMLEYNIKKGAGPHQLARLRKELKEAQEELAEHMYEAMKDWYQVYREDQKRGKGGGSTEGKANNAALKQVMKDNRLRSTKMTQGEREAYYEALRRFEEEHGKLERLSRRI